MAAAEYGVADPMAADGAAIAGAMVMALVTATAMKVPPPMPAGQAGACKGASASRIGAIKIC